MKITFYTHHLRGPEHLGDFRLDASFGGAWVHTVRGHIMRCRDTYDPKVLWPCVHGMFMNTPANRDETEKASAWILDEWKKFAALPYTPRPVRA